MKKVVLVTEPHYGICWLDVERVLALVPEKNMLVFESICWTLSKEDFNKVSEIWHKLKDR